jgi:guanylate kinase
MKVIVEVAKSSSGKDAILNKIVELYPSIKTIVSYTSRPIREGETNGITYHYISDEKVKQMLNNNVFLEHRIYKTIKGDWVYGVSKNSFDLKSDDIYIVILDLQGLKQLKQYLEDNNKSESLTSIYIKASGKTRLLRSLQRENNLDDDMCKEICRRYISDEEDMLGAEEYCDYVVNNEGDLNNTISRVLDILENS